MTVTVIGEESSGSCPMSGRSRWAAAVDLTEKLDQ